MIITITNEKGGVGKSTSVWAMAHALAKRDKKVLLIDLDNQSNLSLIVGSDRSKENVLNLLQGTPGSELVQTIDNIDIIPASEYLSSYEIQLNTETGREYKLKEALEPLMDNYDYILIDTSPSLGILTINAMTAADKVIIPVQADILSAQALYRINQTIETIKKYTNPDLENSGILITRYTPRTNLRQQLRSELEDIAEELNTKVFDHAIRESVVIPEAQLQQVSPYKYAPSNNAVKDYDNFVSEFLRDNNEEES